MTLPVYLRGGFVSGFVVRRAGVPAHVVGGWGGQGGGEGPRKLPLWRGRDHPWGIRVREVSQNGTRREEGEPDLTLTAHLALKGSGGWFWNESA